MDMTPAEKLIALMLADAGRGAGERDGLDYNLIYAAIAEGNIWALDHQYFYLDAESEVPKDVAHEALGIMDMWYLFESIYNQFDDQEKAYIEREADPYGSNVRFSGFDANGEGKHYSAATFSVDHLRMFDSFRERDMNSHRPTLPAYRRMKVVWDELVRNGEIEGLTVDNAVRLLTAQRYPE